jgi:WD40 repeat protein
MARVFLSHSSRDNSAAAELRVWLDNEGFTAAFLDFDKHSGIAAGADWERTLYEQIQRCQALLILQTPNWSASRWCFAEYTQARALGKPIFQVVQTDDAAAEKPIASDLQRLDLRHDRPAGLEQLRRELKRIALQDQGGFPWPPAGDTNRSPFPGLMVFEAEDAPVFFGRDHDWRAVIERLNARRVQGGPRLLVLLGASGAGKSSLLRAGVLPRLRRAGREWLVLPVLRPQARPLESLAQALALALQRPEAWRELFQQLLTTKEVPALSCLVAGWAADLRVAAGSPEAQLLLSIDQAEELFTVAEAAERERFVAVLAAVLQPPLPLQAVMTIRADAMGSLQAQSELVNSLDTLPLGPLSLERYREIIEGPARVAGLRVEPAFVERAIHDTGTKDALPLLAFALRRLHEQVGSEGVLSLSAYQALGDPAAGHSPLENAVKQAADQVLQTQRPDEESLKALREAFVPAMVRVSEQGSYARRAATWDSLPEAARPLLEALVAARLLVKRQSEGQPSTAEVAHEALLRVWPLLRGWLDESRDFLLGSQQLEQDLGQWLAASTADKPRALLSGLKLAKGQAWLAERAHQLRPELRDFIRASQHRAVCRRRILVGSAAGAFAVISGAGGLAFLQLQRARAAEAAQFEATHQALVTSDPFLSVVYGLAAARPLLDGNNPWEAAQLSQSLRQAVQANMAISAPIATDQGRINHILLLSNGDLLSASEDGSLRRWRYGKQLVEEYINRVDQTSIESLIETTDGSIVAGDRRGRLMIWRNGDLTTPPSIIITNQSWVTALAESTNGIIVSGGSDGTLRQWSSGDLASQGAAIQTGQDAILSIIKLRNDALVTGGKNGSIRMWKSGKPLGRIIITGQGSVWSLLELKKGGLVSGGRDGTLRYWHDGMLADNNKPVLTGQGGVRSLVEMNNGELISGGENGTLKIWKDRASAGNGRPIQTDQGGIYSLVKNINGDLVSGGENGTLRFWHDSGDSIPSLAVNTSQGGVTSLIELWNGEVISGGVDGTLRRWQDGRPLGNSLPIQTGQDEILSLVEDKDRNLFSTGSNGTIRTWKTDGLIAKGTPFNAGQGFITSLVSIPNGDLVSSGTDGYIRRWRDGRPVGIAISSKQIEVGSLIKGNNDMLFSGGGDGTVRVWSHDLIEQQEKLFKTGQGRVTVLLKKRDGEIIAGHINGMMTRWQNRAPIGDGYPINSLQGWLSSLIEIKGGVVISAGDNGTLRRWLGGRPIGDGKPIFTGHRGLQRLIALRNGTFLSGGQDGALVWWSPVPIARYACRKIDLDSVRSDMRMGTAAQAAVETCRRLGVKS